jgi:polyisoprenoid-binding protein YceI
MSRQQKVIGGIVAVVVVIAAVAAFGYSYLMGGNTNASAPISAPTLAAGSASQKVFAIDSAQSQVTFTLGEKLMGQPKTVVGTTNQIAGDILVDLDKPANSTLGVLRINARTLSTDSDMRNGMIRREILKSGQDKYEFITFKTTKVEGLPDKVTAGTPVTFKITGDLTVRDVTKPVTFDATVTLASGNDKIDGSATTTVKRSDFGLEIPKVPSVADVTEEVQLAIKFVATTGAAEAADAAATPAQ